MNFHETRDEIISDTKRLIEESKSYKAELKKLNELYTGLDIKDNKWAADTVLVFDLLNEVGSHSSAFDLLKFDNVQFTKTLEQINRYDQYDVLGRLAMLRFTLSRIYFVVKHMRGFVRIYDDDRGLDKKTLEQVERAQYRLDDARGALLDVVRPLEEDCGKLFKYLGINE